MKTTDSLLSATTLRYELDRAATAAGFTVVKRGGGVRPMIVRQRKKDGWARELTAELYYYNTAAQTLRLRVGLQHEPGHGSVTLGEFSFFEDEIQVIPTLVFEVLAEKAGAAEKLRKQASKRHSAIGAGDRSYWWSQRGEDAEDQRRAEVEAQRAQRRPRPR